MPKKILWDDINIKKRIIEKYYSVIEDFLIQLEKILIHIPDINITICMVIGINSIHRVFEYVIIKTKNIEKAFYYAQRTYIYYIEYMEQIHNVNLQNALNQTDAVLFIYKKTLFEIHNGDDSKIFDTITNIMTFEEEITEINNKNYNLWLHKLLKIINVFFNWNNQNLTFQNRTSLSKMLLKKFMLYINTDVSIQYLELIQEKIIMEYETYSNLINELLEYEIKKNQSYIDNEDETLLMKFYIEKKTLYTKFENNDMKGLVKWLYTPIEL